MSKISVSALALANGSGKSSEYQSWFNLDIQGIEFVPGKLLNSWPDVKEGEVSSFIESLEINNWQVPAMQAFLFGKHNAQIFINPDNFCYEIEKIAELSKTIQCPYLIWGAPGSRDKGNLSDKEAFDHAVKIIKPLSDKLSEMGVALLMEHVPEYYGCNFMNTPEQVLDLVSAVNSDGFGLHLDLGSLDDISQLNLIPLSKHIHASERNLKPFIQSEIHKKASDIIRNQNRWISLEMLPNSDGCDKTLEFIKMFIEVYK